jgi:hypothetical protein
MAGSSHSKVEKKNLIPMVPSFVGTEGAKQDSNLALYEQPELAGFDNSVETIPAKVPAIH